MAQDSSNITDITDLINEALEVDRKEIEEAEYEFTDPDWIPGSVGTGGQGVSSVGGHTEEGYQHSGTGEGTVVCMGTMTFSVNQTEENYPVRSMSCAPPDVPMGFHTMMRSGSDTTIQFATPTGIRDGSGFQVFNSAEEASAENARPVPQDWMEQTIADHVEDENIVDAIIETEQAAFSELDDDWDEDAQRSRLNAFQCAARGIGKLVQTVNEMLGR